MVIVWLGKKLGLNLRYFLSSGGWIGARYFVVSAVSLVVSVIFARLGGSELYGQYQYVLGLAALFSVSSLPGLNAAVLKDVTQGKERTLSTAAFVSLRFSLVGAVLLVLWGVYQLTLGAATGWALVAAGVLLPLFYAPNIWYVLEEGRLDFRTPSLKIILQTVAALLTLLIGLILGLPLVALVALYFAVGAAFNWGFLWMALRKISPSAPQSRLDRRYALNVTFQKFTNTMAENLQPIAITYFFGYAQFALFQVAFVCVNALSGFISALGSTYLPLLFKYKTISYRAIYWQNLGFGVLASLVYVLIVATAFVPLYGETFLPSYKLALIFAPLVALLPLRTFLVNFFTAQKRNLLVVGSNLGAAVIALLILSLGRGWGFERATISYFYSLQVLSVLFLSLAYLQKK